MSKKYLRKNQKLPIGQTLETKDDFLPHYKTSQIKKSSRPVIIADVIINNSGKEEYMIIPVSKKTNNTSFYGKYGIKRYRNIVEVFDNENKPIMNNKKFRKTTKSIILFLNDVKQITNKVINHTKFSSENRGIYRI